MSADLDGGGLETLSCALDALVLSELHARNIPGAVLVVGQAGRVVHRRAYGFAERYSFNGRPLSKPEKMTVNHVFDLASLTKVFATTFGLMLLADRADLDLEKPVSYYLSVFDWTDKKTIPLHQLLSHTAGLVEWQPLYLFAGEPREALRYLAALPLKYRAGGSRKYSDLGFMILGACIETITGQPLDVFLEQELYRPMGLSHTVFCPEPERFSLMAATSHGNPLEYQMAESARRRGEINRRPDSFSGWRNYVLKGEVNDGNAFHVFGGVAGHAGLFGSADDLLLLTSLLTGMGETPGGRLLKAGTVRRFLDGTRYGSPLGWSRSSESIMVDEPPPGTIGHTGFTGTSVVVLPESGISVILLTNRQHGGLKPDGSYPDVNPLRRLVAQKVFSALSGG